MSGYVLDVRALSAAYGKVEALHGASLKVASGQIVTVIGPNGAGKTTLLAAIMGALPLGGSMRGRILFDGVERAGQEIEQMVAAGMTLVPETRELFGEMTVADNLLLGAFQRFRRGERDQAATMDEVFALFPRLHERRAQRAGTLSGGERQMLAFGMALMLHPKLLMIDEPSIGLAPKLVTQIFDAIVGIREQFGTAVLIVEQQAQQVLRICDEVFIIRAGRLISSGPVDNYRGEDALRQVYLKSDNAEQREGSVT